MLVALVVVDRSSGNRSLAVKDPGNPAADLGKQGGQALQGPKIILKQNGQETLSSLSIQDVCSWFSRLLHRLWQSARQFDWQQEYYSCLRLLRRGE